MPESGQVRKTKQVPCAICGKPITVGARRKLPSQHVECGIRKVVEQNHQMHEHSGPYYEKWRRRMAQWAETYLGGTPSHE